MVPKLTAEQRRAALDKGMQIRIKRAEYKAKLKNVLMSNISTSRRVQGLGYIQREGLIEALGGGRRE